MCSPELKKTELSMLKKASAKQQGKMTASDILHANTFIFYFEK